MLRRGFKTEAERLAEELRAQMDLRADEPVSPFRIADHLGVGVHAASDLVPQRALDELHRLQDDAFSAITFKLDAGVTAVVYNSFHAPVRVNSDVAHELAHLILGHETSTIERTLIELHVQY